MMKLLSVLIPIFLTVAVHAQEGTDVSLYLKKNPATQLDSVSSKSGNLFRKLGHHGPAVENPWAAFRLYFDKRTAIDLYSKANPGLELKKHQWYPEKKDQLAGSGADSYKVGKTIGLGGIRLWHDGKLIPLHPVSLRWARVGQEADSSWMDLYSMQVPYAGKEVDILIRVTVYPDRREARVSAISLDGGPVRFVTGINYFNSLDVRSGQGFLATWGLHPEGLAVTRTEVGAALLYQEKDFEQQVNDGRQILLISKPRIQLETWISPASSGEEELDSPERFLEYLKKQIL